MFIKKSIILISSSLLITIFLPILFHGNISLELFINYTFVISLLHLSLTLLMVTVKSGFYDGITFGFRRFFITNGRYLSKQEVENIQPLSHLIKFNQLPFLASGTILFIVMLFSLFIYYS
ncbi:DUF3899 domain-containing protein [Metabacillus fastidiosus]|uniref:DUF3899 domain-containing protein n=1 Tax=Metabacillus fastidiosus TaxID=1458 RepID=UPI003AEF39DF